MDSDEHRAAIERELAEALEEIAREDGDTDASDAYATVAGDPKRYERAFRLALQVFRLSALARTNHAPLSTVESAAAIVAAHLGHIPAEGTEEWRHWHVSFPVAVEKERVITEAQKRRRQCHVFVARLMAQDPDHSFGSAALIAQPHFNRGYDWVKDCYYDAELRAKYKPLLDLEYARAKTSKNRDGKNRTKRVSQKIEDKS
jgi:hypothetical protein